MPVQAIHQPPQPTATQEKNINLSPDEFSKLLESLRNPKGVNGIEQKKESTPVAAPLKTESKQPITRKQTIRQSSETIELGIIDKNNPTISHLLKSNSKYEKNAWNIIFSDSNKTKDFSRKIQSFP